MRNAAGQRAGLRSRSSVNAADGVDPGYEYQVDGAEQLLPDADGQSQMVDSEFFGMKDNEEVKDESEP